MDTNKPWIKKKSWKQKKHGYKKPYIQKTLEIKKNLNQKILDQTTSRFLVRLSCP